MGKKKKTQDRSVLATNRRARHDYHILETYECGVVLVGTEIKSLREGKVSIADAFATVDEGEVWLRNLHIPEYSMGSWTNHSPKRTRKLLLHQGEIRKLIGKTQEKGLTLVPLRVYLKRGKVKVELGVARGKKLIDKRETERRKEADREARSAMKSRR